MNRKPRSDSKLETLPPERKAALEQWLCAEQIGYRPALARLFDEFGVRSSQRALSAFYQRCQQQRLLERIEQARNVADSIKGELEKAAPLTGASAINLISQKSFELAAAGSCDVKQLYLLTKLMLEAKAQDLKERQLALDWEKWQFDAAKAALKELPRLRQIAADKALDDDAKLEQARLALFGVAPK